jgi:hypothetical protein
MNFAMSRSSPSRKGMTSASADDACDSSVSCPNRRVAGTYF